MLFKELFWRAGYTVPEDLPECEVTGICCDSRRVLPGNLFVAINGMHCDGTAFIPEAVAKGALYTVSEKKCAGVPNAVTDNARIALARFSDAFFGHPAIGMKLIGITGTNGKTSTAEMLEHILIDAGKICGLIGTVSCRCAGKTLFAANADSTANMTTPDPTELYSLLAQMRELRAEYVVMEVTSHALSLGKTEPLFFTRAVFTNLTPDHLDFHQDMETYYTEKKKLFSSCEKAVISFSTPYGKRLSEEIKVPFFPISENTVSQVAKKGVQGVDFTLRLPNEELQIHIPVPGSFTVENGALAAATACSLGIPAACAVNSLASFHGVQGRMEKLPENPFSVHVFIDYAHTPDALRKFLLCVREFADAGQRIFLVFGCGGDRDRGKRKEMGRIATRLADFTVLTQDNSRNENPERILHEVLAGMDREKPYKIISDRKEAIRFAVFSAQPGDIILLCGKGHEQYEIQQGKRIPFSEREIVLAAIAERAAGECHAD